MREKETSSQFILAAEKKDGARYLLTIYGYLLPINRSSVFFIDILFTEIIFKTIQ